MMTHDGPYGFKTTLDEHEGESDGLKAGTYYYGSTGLTELLHEHKERILGLVHGHNHYAVDYVDSVDEVKVVNTSPFKFGKYGVMELKREAGKWKIDSITPKYLK